MKKNKIFLMLATLSISLVGCDYNDQFGGLEEDKKPTDVQKLEYTITDADYASMAKSMTVVDSAQWIMFKNNKAFNDGILAKDHIPAFLASAFYTLDAGSEMNVTYNHQSNLPPYISAINAGKMYTVSTADYKTVWGEESDTKYFTPSKPAANYLPAILAASQAEATEGDVILASYKVAETEPQPSGNTIIEEKFDGVTNDADAEITGWLNITTEGTYSWKGKEYSENFYIQQGANTHVGALTSYMIMPKIDAKDNTQLTFDYKWGFFTLAGGRISVVVSEDFVAGTDNATNIAAANAATWEDITSLFEFNLPTADATGYAPKFINVGKGSLAQFNGKSVYIAFKYTGNGDENATSTMQMDNVKVFEGTVDNTPTTTETELYEYKDGAWKVYPFEDENLSFLKKDDFAAMGSDYDNFNANLLPDDYLPQYLAAKYPFAQKDDVAAVGYKFYNFDDKSNTLRADEYVFTDSSAWVKNDGIKAMTSKFSRKAEWIFDTSIKENFDQFKSDMIPAMILGWTNVTLKGDADWSGKTYKSNGYIEASAFYATAELEAWMITPQCLVEEGMIFTFTLKHRYFKGEALSIWISEDFAAGTDDASNTAAVQAANWTNVTEQFTIVLPGMDTSDNEFLSVDKMDLSNYVGKNISIAFKYVGNKAGITSSVQIDDVIVGIPQ